MGVQGVHRALKKIKKKKKRQYYPNPPTIAVMKFPRQAGVIGKGSFPWFMVCQCQSLRQSEHLDWIFGDDIVSGRVPRSKRTTCAKRQEMVMCLSAYFLLRSEFNHRGSMLAILSKPN